MAIVEESGLPGEDVTGRVGPPDLTGPRKVDMSLMDMARHSGLPELRRVNRQRVQAAVAFHLGGKLPGIEWTRAVDPISDRFMDLAYDNPQLVSMLEEDVNTLYALTDADLAARIARGEPVSAFGDIFDAIAEVSWEVGATELAARFNAEAADAMSGRFEALTSTEALDLALEGRGPALPGVRAGVPTARAAAFQTLFDVPGAWSYSPSERTLAVTVGEQTVGIETRPGFNPVNHLDVMAEVVAAQADGRIRGGGLTGGQKATGVERLVDSFVSTAHEIGHFLEEHPGAQRFVDSVWEAFTEGHAFGAEPGPIGRASERMRDEKGQVTVESIRLASVLPFPEDAVTAMVARRWMEDSQGALTSKDALTLAGETVAENRGQLEAEYESLTSEELVEQLEEDIEGQSALGAAVESGLGSVLTTMEGWDRFTQWIGVNILDVIGDYLSASDAISSGDWEEGFARFKMMMETQEYGTTAGEYFGLSGSAADAANLAVSIGFDPLNLIFPGAKGVRAIAEKGLTNPKFAGLYLKMGQFPAVAKQIAEEGGAKGVRAVLGQSLLDDDEYVDLVKLALDENSTVGQVNAVWTRAMSKDWLGEGFMRAQTRDTIVGLGQWAENLAGGRISDQHLDTFVKTFTKLNARRTFTLGENRALHNYGDLVVQLYPTDGEKAANFFLQAVEARAMAGDDLALAGASAAMKEQARRSALESGGTISAVQGGEDVRVINQNLRSVEDALANLHRQGMDEATEAAVRTELNRMHAVMSRRVDDARPKIIKAQAKKRLAHEQLKKATRLEADHVANASRNVMARQPFLLYEQKAQDLNAQFGREVIPVIKGQVNPFAPDVPVRDWSAVTGPVKGRPPSDADLSLMMGLASDDPELAKLADAVGMGARSQHVLLPASPYEVILFEKLGHDKGAFQKVTQALRRQEVKKIGHVMKGTFAFNLLVNFLTAGRVTLDETWRFFAKTAELGQFARASLAGLPGVGKGTETIVTNLRKMRSPTGEAIVSPWAQQYKRGVIGHSPDDYADYGWVERPARRVGPGQMSRADYRLQVERWVNGTLMQNRPFRHYARWLDQATLLDDGTLLPPAEFIEWWERGADAPRPGKADTKPIKVTVRDEVMLGSELTATDAFNITNRVFETWLDELVDPAQRELMRKTILDVARGARSALNLEGDEQLLNAVLKVPGLSGQTGVGSQIFNIFFGAPAGRRAGVFYEHYFDEAMRILTARHGDRLLTVDKLMDYAKVDRQTAEFWLKEGSENATVSQLIRETGARTEGQLAARAAAYAERRANDLMYRYSATSLIGRGVESGLVFPFARAQTDFLSWWTKHLFSPMTVRLSMEQRAKLPGLIRQLTEGVERIPINLRAWAKYAHLVAVTNNEQDSLIDQAIDDFTFIPTKFGSNFLLDMFPQFGPIPSWLFDVLVDQGKIPPDVEAQFEALFPALGFTEFEGDWPGDFMNRVLPVSKRSVRDFTVGMLRGAYGLFGSDVHTAPGLMGWIANLLADNQVPFATRDFQVALTADFLKDHIWEMVPGSDEFKAAMAALAVEGAAEANRAEWVQDRWDRILPLAGGDQEVRALGSFATMFDEERFSAMVAAGLFAGNDLFEVDGEPRIKVIWDKFEAGTATPEELDFLNDRLHTVYFDAGRIDLLPGFSYMDYLNLTAPEITVNLIGKSEDSGIPVRGGEQTVGDQRMTHAEFKQKYINALTDRTQNIPPGDTGTEIIRDARAHGWLTSRPMEEWAQDAAEAVYKSGQRALRGVWESVSHRSWQQGLKKSIEDKRFTLPAKQALILQKAGMDIEAGASFTYAEFHALLDEFDERFRLQPHLANALDSGAVHKQLALHDDAFGTGLIEAIHQAELDADDLGYSSIEDWPETVKAKVRDRYREAINLGYTTLADYAQEIEPIFGPLDYQPPTPPPVEELETGLVIAGDDLADLAVIDGDTVSILLEDGPMRVRFIGINAPEVTQQGYAEARANLEEVVAEASEVVIGVYQPELFGLTQQSAPGERRLLAWLFVDGVPIYDPAVFTADNPRGAGLGGNVLDLQAILEAGRP